MLFSPLPTHTTLGSRGPIAPQPSGYHAIDSGTAAGRFRVYDGEGDLLSEGGTRFDAWIIAPDPDGGSALYEWDTVARKPSGAFGDRLELMGADGKPRASTLLDRPPADLAVTFGGDVLVLSFDGRGWSGRWFDRGARPLGDWFALPGTGVAGARPALLADGSVGVHDGTRWIAVVPDGKEAAAVPAWLVVALAAGAGAGVVLALRIRARRRARGLGSVGQVLVHRAEGHVLDQRGLAHRGAAHRLDHREAEPLARLEVGRAGGLGLRHPAHRHPGAVRPGYVLEQEVDPALLLEQAPHPLGPALPSCPHRLSRGLGGPPN